MIRQRCRRSAHASGWVPGHAPSSSWPPSPPVPRPWHSRHRHRPRPPRTPLRPRPSTPSAAPFPWPTVPSSREVPVPARFEPKGRPDATHDQARHPGGPLALLADGGTGRVGPGRGPHDEPARHDGLVLVGRVPHLGHARRRRPRRRSSHRARPQTGNAAAFKQQAAPLDDRDRLRAAALGRRLVRLHGLRAMPSSSAWSQPGPAPAQGWRLAHRALRLVSLRQLRRRGLAAALATGPGDGDGLVALPEPRSNDHR